MHWALRLPKDDQSHPELAKQVHIQLERMYALVEKIHAGQCRGATGEVIQDVVNIGVGGSDLGPLMVSHALSDFKNPHISHSMYILFRPLMVASFRIYCINLDPKPRCLLFLQNRSGPLIPYLMRKQCVYGLKKHLGKNHKF